MDKEAMQIMLNKTEEDLHLSLFYSCCLLGIGLMEKVGFANPSELPQLEKKVISSILETMPKVKYLCHNIPFMQDRLDKDLPFEDIDYFEDQFYENQKIVKGYTNENLMKEFNKFVDKAKENFDTLRERKKESL